MSYFYPSQNRIEDIKEKQVEVAAATVRTEFATERILYCQDSVYSQDLNTVREQTDKETGQAATTKRIPNLDLKPVEENASFAETAYHLKAYF